MYQHVSQQFQPFDQIEALLLTTFGLDVEYLEKSILPAFFPWLGEGPASEPHRPLFEYLEETPTPISIMYDANNLLKGETLLASTGSVFKELRWQAHPVMRESGCFHPKLIIALTRKDDQHSIVVGCSSANLTRPGWGRNFEACGMDVIELRSGMRSALLEEVSLLIDTLAKLSEESEAIAKIRLIIDKLQINRYTNRPPRGSATRLWFGQNNKNLSTWIEEHILPQTELCSDVAWRLEVISPYFSEEPPAFINWVNTCFSQRQFESDSPPILVYCPRDGDLVDISPDVVTAFGLLKQSAWADFMVDPLASQLRDPNGDRLRRFLHAKVYRFWQPNYEIIIVGSANASTQGHRDKLPANDEACLIFHHRVKEGAAHFTPWLKPLSKPILASECKAKIDREDQPRIDPVPGLSIVFDWQSKTISVKNYDTRKLAIYLGGISVPLLTVDPKEYVDNQPLNSSHIDALFRSPTAKIVISELLDKAWMCLVAEQNLHLKPPAPAMERNIDDLIRDWQLGSDQRQAEHIARAAMPDDVRAMSEGSSPELDEGVEQDRLNDLFMAMYRFRSDIEGKLNETPDPDSFAMMQLRARLFGKGVMSVRYLMNKLNHQSQDQEAAAFDVMEQYIGILALRDALARLRKGIKAAGMIDEMTALRNELNKVYRSKKKQLITALKQDPNSPNPEQLIKWTERYFKHDLPIPSGVE